MEYTTNGGMGESVTAYTYGLYRESCTVTMPLPSAGATYSAAPPSTAMTYYYTGTGSVSNLTGKGMGQSYSYGLEGKASVYAMHGSGAGAGTGGTGAAAAVPGPAGTYGISGTCAAYAYNGEYTHETLGLQYLRARYYNMAAGTFTSRDTYAGRIGDILSQNRYTYAENNPVTYADPSGHISIKSAWNAVKTGAKTAASAARAVTSAVTAAVRTGASAVSNAIKGAVSKPTVKLGHLSSKTVNQTPSAYAKVSGASRNQAVQQKAAKSAAWADLVGQPVSMCEAAAAWADWGAEKAAGYVDESLIGNGAMLAALKVKAAECWAYSQLENSMNQNFSQLHSDVHKHDMAIEDLLDEWAEKKSDEDDVTARLQESAHTEKLLLELFEAYQEQFWNLKHYAVSKDEALTAQVALMEKNLEHYRRSCAISIIQECGVSVDYDLHDVIEAVDTTDPSLDKTIAEIYRCGYLYKGKVRKKAQAAAYRLSNS